MSFNGGSCDQYSWILPVLVVPVVDVSDVVGVTVLVDSVVTVSGMESIGEIEYV